jgi:hypothetical protein
VRENKVTIIVQMALEKHPDLPSVPLILEFARTPQDRQGMELAVASLLMGRPYVLPEGVPPDRVNILRGAFMAAVRDPELLADAKKAHLEVDPIDGDAVHRVLARMYATPQAVVDQVTAIFVPKEK